MIELDVLASDQPNETGAPARRRTPLIAGVAAATVAVLVAVAAMWALARDVPTPPAGVAPTRGAIAGSTPAGAAVGGSGSTAVPNQGVSAAVLDIGAIVANSLVLPDGGTVTLPGTLSLGGGYETRDGWLLDGFEHRPLGYSLWLVTPDHSVHGLVSGAADPVAVAPDGRRFAWRDNSQMFVGHLRADGTLAVDRAVPRPAQGMVFAYTGSAVILGGGCCSGVVLFDVWLPDRGGYLPSWDATAHVRGMYGVRTGTGHLIGLVLGPQGGKELCLAELDPLDELRAVATACGVAGLLTNDGRVSPDGRWAAIPSTNPDTGAAAVDVVDLSTVFDQPKIIVHWNVEFPVSWLDGTTAVARGDDGRLFRLRVSGPTREELTVPDVLANRLNLVQPLQRLR